MQIDYELGSLAASQAGYLGYDQVVNRGMTDAAIRWRLEKKFWVPAGRGLYRVSGITGDHRALLRAAVAILPDAVASHESAAELLEIPYVPRGSATVTVHASTTHDFPDVRIHRSIDLFAHHRTETNGLTATNAARTLNDLAAVLKPGHMALVLDESLAARIAAFEEVKAVFGEVARRGRTGTALMRKLIEQRDGTELISATRLERVGKRVFDDGGLPKPVFQYPAPWKPERKIDFAWPDYCVGCECDSRRWHTRIKDFQNDRDRDNFALEHNWRIYRFTWNDFTKRPHLVVEQLRKALVA
jgi:hypothetical protein